MLIQRRGDTTKTKTFNAEELREQRNSKRKAEYGFRKTKLKTKTKRNHPSATVAEATTVLEVSYGHRGEVRTRRRLKIRRIKIDENLRKSNNLPAKLVNTGGLASARIRDRPKHVACNEQQGNHKL